MIYIFIQFILRKILFFSTTFGAIIRDTTMKLLKNYARQSKTKTTTDFGAKNIKRIPYSHFRKFFCIEQCDAQKLPVNNFDQELFHEHGRKRSQKLEPMKKFISIRFTPSIIIHIRAKISTIQSSSSCLKTEDCNQPL